MKFPLHNSYSAPAKARNLLSAVGRLYGSIPAVACTIAESPIALEAYSALAKAFDDAAFSDAERDVILLTLAASHRCPQCFAVRAAAAHRRGVDEGIVRAIQSRETIGDERLEALRRFCTKIRQSDGNLSDEELRSFLQAGFVQKNVFEILVALSLEAMSHYTTHVADLHMAFDKSEPSPSGPAAGHL